jgi:D-hexose-6-phosphate mutarotase
VTAIELRSSRITARVQRQGAQVLDATFEGQPLLWLSPLADFTPGKAVRGGVPICFPWFGKHPQGLPAHGFARTQDWVLLSQAADRVRLGLDDNPATLALWPHRFHAEIDIVAADGLDFTLTVENRDTAAFSFSYALHSYFAVTDSGACRVQGLDGRLRREVGHVTTPHAGDVTLHQAVDAIFEQAPGTLTLQDGTRRVQIDAAQMRSAVVWNPGVAALDIGDIGAHWPEYVCVERGNMGTAAINLAPGEVHQASMRIRIA